MPYTSKAPISCISPGLTVALVFTSDRVSVFVTGTACAVVVGSTDGIGAVGGADGADGMARTGGVGGEFVQTESVLPAGLTVVITTSLGFPNAM